jgi:hypothetical protein
MIGPSAGVADNVGGVGGCAVWHESIRDFLFRNLKKKEENRAHSHENHDSQYCRIETQHCHKPAGLVFVIRNFGSTEYH